MTIMAHGAGPVAPACKTELRRLKQGELKLAEELPFAVLDQTGRQLLPKGHLLGRADLLQLPNRLYTYAQTCPRFPGGVDGLSPDEALARQEGEALIREMYQTPRIQKRSEKRRRDRRPWKTRIRIRLQSTGVVLDAPWTVVEVSTQDISQGGFAFIYDQELPIGTQVALCLETLPSKPLVNGTTRNCTPTKDGHYRIGVQFLKVA